MDLVEITWILCSDSVRFYLSALSYSVIMCSTAALPPRTMKFSWLVNFSALALRPPPPSARSRGLLMCLSPILINVCIYDRSRLPFHAFTLPLLRRVSARYRTTALTPVTQSHPLVSCKWLCWTLNSDSCSRSSLVLLCEVSARLFSSCAASHHVSTSAL